MSHYEQQLADDVATAVKAVQNLVKKEEQPAQAEVLRGTEGMPAGEVVQCAGLALTFTHKAGAVLTLESGRGFVVRKIPIVGGFRWSAPLFIKARSVGAGLTLGASAFESVTVLDTPEAVQAFTQSQWVLGTEVGAEIGGAIGRPVGSHGAAPTLDITHPALTSKTFSYSVARGAILDISWSAMHYSVDAAANEHFYGAATSPQAVLDGLVQAPGAMAELYAALNQIIKDAGYSPASA